MPYDQALRPKIGSENHLLENFFSKFNWNIVLICKIYTKLYCYCWQARNEKNQFPTRNMIWKKSLIWLSILMCSNWNQPLTCITERIMTSKCNRLAWKFWKFSTKSNSILIKFHIVINFHNFWKTSQLRSSQLFFI